jgi:hypothetical protein
VQHATTYCAFRVKKARVSPTDLMSTCKSGATTEIISVRNPAGGMFDFDDCTCSAGYYGTPGPTLNYDGSRVATGWKTDGVCTPAKTCLAVNVVGSAPWAAEGSNCGTIDSKCGCARIRENTENIITPHLRYKLTELQLGTACKDQIGGCTFEECCFGASCLLNVSV